MIKNCRTIKVQKDTFFKLSYSHQSDSENKFELNHALEIVQLFLKKHIYLQNVTQLLTQNLQNFCI